MKGKNRMDSSNNTKSLKGLNSTARLSIFDVGKIKNETMMKPESSI